MYKASYGQHRVTVCLGYLEVAGDRSVLRSTMDPPIQRQQQEMGICACGVLAFHRVCIDYVDVVNDEWPIKPFVLNKMC